TRAPKAILALGARVMSIHGLGRANRERNHDDHGVHHPRHLLRFGLVVIDWLRGLVRGANGGKSRRFCFLMWIPFTYR
ncbi:MAG: hypothetical protein AAGG02_19925, partial [Cyanobacteria bacterium P01_H01_bin.15]